MAWAPISPTLDRLPVPAAGHGDARAVLLLLLGLAVALAPELVPGLMTPAGRMHETTSLEMESEMEMPA